MDEMERLKKLLELFPEVKQSSKEDALKLAYDRARNPGAWSGSYAYWSNELMRVKEKQNADD